MITASYGGTPGLPKTCFDLVCFAYVLSINYLGKLGVWRYFCRHKARARLSKYENITKTYETQMVVHILCILHIIVYICILPDLFVIVILCVCFLTFWGILHMVGHLQHENVPGPRIK